MRMNKADILAELRSFPYPLEGFWLVAGAALVLHGVRETCSDIDMGCTTEAADRLERDGYLYRTTSDGCRWFKIGRSTEVFENWICGPLVFVEGIPLLTLPGLREMKLRLGRDKDLADIQLIDAFLDASSGLS